MHDVSLLNLFGLNLQGKGAVQDAFFQADSNLRENALFNRILEMVSGGIPGFLKKPTASLQFPSDFVLPQEPGSEEGTIGSALLNKLWPQETFPMPRVAEKQDGAQEKLLSQIKTLLLAVREGKKAVQLAKVLGGQNGQAKLLVVEDKKQGEIRSNQNNQTVFLAMPIWKPVKTDEIAGPENAIEIDASNGKSDQKLETYFVNPVVEMSGNPGNMVQISSAGMNITPDDSLIAEEVKAKGQAENSTVLIDSKADLAQNKSFTKRANPTEEPIQASGDPIIFEGETVKQGSILLETDDLQEAGKANNQSESNSVFIQSEIGNTKNEALKGEANHLPNPGFPVENSVNEGNLWLTANEGGAAQPLASDLIALQEVSAKGKPRIFALLAEKKSPDGDFTLGITPGKAISQPSANGVLDSSEGLVWESKEFLLVPMEGAPEIPPAGNHDSGILLNEKPMPTISQEAALHIAGQENLKEIPAVLVRVDSVRGEKWGRHVFATGISKEQPAGLTIQKVVIRTDGSSVQPLKSLAKLANYLRHSMNTADGKGPLAETSVYSFEASQTATANLSQASGDKAQGIEKNVVSHKIPPEELAFSVESEHDVEARRIAFALPKGNGQKGTAEEKKPVPDLSGMTNMAKEWIQKKSVRSAMGREYIRSEEQTTPQISVKKKGATEAKKVENEGSLRVENLFSGKELPNTKPAAGGSNGKTSPIAAVISEQTFGAGATAEGEAPGKKSEWQGNSSTSSAHHKEKLGYFEQAKEGGTDIGKTASKITETLKKDSGFNPSKNGEYPLEFAESNGTVAIKSQAEQRATQISTEALSGKGVVESKSTKNQRKDETGSSTSSQKSEPFQHLPEQRNTDFVDRMKAVKTGAEKTAQSDPHQETFPQLSRAALDKLVKNTRLLIQNQGGQIQIQLKPDVLGGARLLVEALQNQVSVKILVDKPETRHVLEQHVQALHAAVAQQSGRIQEVQISIQVQSDALHQNQAQNQGQGQRSGTSQQNQQNQENRGFSRNYGNPSQTTETEREMRKFGYNSMEMVA